MHTRRRKSAAELYAGAFVGEVKGLSARSSRVHLTALLLLLVLLLLGVRAILLSPYWLPAPGAPVLAIEQLQLDSGERLRLPHRAVPLPGREPAVMTLWADVDGSSLRGDNHSLYIPIHYNRLRVALNGQRLLPLHQDEENPLAMWHRGSLFQLPTGLLAPGRNRVELELVASTQLLELSTIYLGAHRDLFPSYDTRRFVSYAFLWTMFFAAVLSSAASLALHVAGGQRFLLAAIPVTALIALHATTQLTDAAWFDPAVHLFAWLLNALAILYLALLISNSRWRRGPLRWVLAGAMLSGTLLALVVYFVGWVDLQTLTWWLAVFVMGHAAVLSSALVVSALLTIYREETRALNPFLSQMIQTRLVICAFAWLALLSMLGVVREIPMDLINSPFVLVSVNWTIVALISAIARTQTLLEYRENLEAKVHEQERRLCLLNHEHLEAMRWSVIGQSTRMLMAEIRAPLARIARDLDALRLDEGFAANRGRWLRLKSSTDRCVKHVRVVESLIADDEVQLTAVRMDQYVERGMVRLSERYNYDWTLQSSIRGWLMADTRLLDSVMEAIVDNAHHSAAAAGRRLVLSLGLSVEGGYLRLCVQDNGKGIDNHEDVFQPFHTSKAFGLGLGVNLAQKRLNAMGGYLTLEPCDFGALFCVYLPRGTSD